MKKLIFIIGVLSIFYSISKDNNLYGDFNSTRYSNVDFYYYTDSIPYPIDNQFTEERFQLGRRLFYDNILSGNNKYSCASCHKQEYAFTDGLPLAIGAHGDTLTRNTMSLVNLAWNERFFWDGRITSLEELILIPITNPKEMDQDTMSLMDELNAHQEYPKLFKEAYKVDKITSQDVSKAISTFLRGIVNRNSFADNFLKYIIHNKESALKVQDQFTKNEIKYFVDHFNKENVETVNLCASCHGNFLYGAFKFENNGLLGLDTIPGLFTSTLDSNHFAKLKVPTLRNIQYTAPYMHDGRFNTLDEVLDHYENHIQNTPYLSERLKDAEGKYPITFKLNKKQKQHILQTLYNMSDSTIFSQKFSNPDTVK